jgi:predicted RNA-binding Zn-ribbon protein involved in translation (DUF1610 family)
VSEITPETHTQGMACLSCGLAGETPVDHFPQEPGLWDSQCPGCGEMMVWVTGITRREQAAQEVTS